MGDSAEYGGLVSADYLAEAARVLAEIKASSADLLGVAPGEAVLDLGCGPGTDTWNLAEVVGDDGLAVGLDHDIGMAAAADSAGGQWTRRPLHLVADRHHLPWPPGSFDAEHSDRMLQHVDRPEEAIREVLRVLRPGGRAVIVDTDWSTLSIDTLHADVERRPVRHKCDDLTRCGTAGRSLNLNPPLWWVRGLGAGRMLVWSR